MQQRASFRLSALIAVLITGLVFGTRITAAENPAGQINYTIIVTGAELLSGVYADGHTQYITRMLLPLGLHCIGSISVDDKAQDMERALAYAAGQSDLIIVTGGLGPTKNDITRDVLSGFTGIALEENPEVIASMTRRFGISAGQLRDNLRRQARVPQQGTYLENRSGTAVGLVFEWKSKLIIALPGPPRELQPMVENTLKPFLATRYGVRANGSSLTIRFVGIGQSQIDQTLKDSIRLPDRLGLTTQFIDGRVDFTFTLPDDSTASRQQLDKLKEDLLTHLGAHIYATDDNVTLEQCVVSRLAERQQTLCVLEVASGGSLVAAITNGTRQDQEILEAGYVAPTSGQLHALLSPPKKSGDLQRAEISTDELLKTAASTHTSDWLVAIGEPFEEQGNRFVHAAFQQRNQPIKTVRLPLRDRSRSSRARFTTMVLDQFRRQLEE